MNPEAYQSAKINAWNKIMATTGTVVDMEFKHIPEFQPFYDLPVTIGLYGIDWQIHDVRSSDYLWNEETQN